MTFAELQTSCRRAELEGKIFLTIYKDPKYERIGFLPNNNICKTFIAPYFHPQARKEYKNAVFLMPIAGTDTRGSYWIFLDNQDQISWIEQHKIYMVQAAKKDLLLYLDKPLDQDLIVSILNGTLRVLE